MTDRMSEKPLREQDRQKVLARFRDLENALIDFDVDCHSEAVDAVLNVLLTLKSQFLKVPR